MSSIPISAAQAPGINERRAHLRRRLDQLAYIGFGPDSGGVLLDISEEGLRCQIVGAVVEGDRCHLKFALPGHPSAIESDGQVVWSNKSRQGGGVRLLGLGDDVRQQLQQWIGGEIPSAGGGAPPIPIPTRALAPARVLPVASASGAVATARETPRSEVPVSARSPRRRPQPSVQPQALLAIRPSAKRDARAAWIAVGAACLILVVAGLALSDINLARVTDLVLEAIRPGGGPITATAAVPAPEATAAISHAGPLDEYMAPQLSSDVADYVSSVPSEPDVPKTPISRAVPAPPEPPVQRPPVVARENRQRLAMALPRPRTVTPEPPAAALPPPDAAVPVAPPIALLDPQTLETSLPELPQPVQPPSGTTYQQPELIRRVEPVYSSFARDARLQGSVQITATIGTDGVPRSLESISGNSALADMAIDAVRRWRYQPAQLNGQTIEAQTVITFNFQLR